MKKISLTNLFLAAVLVSSTAVAGYSQRAGISAVNEINVRAQMQFLASDALQGRGSGTVFERIAAEYIGSQFMQFGLEPAGEAGADGKPSYVQTVTISRKTFSDAPTIMVGSSSFTHGKELAVLRTNTASAGGDLVKLEPGKKPVAGSAVFLLLNGVTDQRTIVTAARAMNGAGASIVLIEETPEMRANWAEMSQLPSFTAGSSKPSVFVAVSKGVAESIRLAPDGTRIEMQGKLAASQDRYTWNAMGKITGSDKTLAAEVILLTSHLDHLGVSEANPGDDKIFNGADDDASGSVAVLELARVLGSGAKPKRTVYFVCFGSEEAGGFGARYFVENMPFAKEKLVANLEFEMIGRPDAMVKAEELWLTGYERSNLGPELAKRGAKLVQDPHPTENFFMRSDNIQLARAGIIAHTVSSFGLHTDYHKASDEFKTIDLTHMTRSINSMVEPVKWLVNSNFKPVWNEGMKP